MHYLRFGSFCKITLFLSLTKKKHQRYQLEQANVAFEICSNGVQFQLQHCLFFVQSLHGNNSNKNTGTTLNQRRRRSAFRRILPNSTFKYLMNILQILLSKPTAPVHREVNKIQYLLTTMKRRRASLLNLQTKTFAAMMI